MKQTVKKIVNICRSYNYYGNLNDAHNAGLLYYDYRKVLRLKKQAISQGLKLIDNYIDTKKKSDTIFILGSGESINYITDLQWEEIKNHNTLGFNYYFAHKFVPDYYMIELNKWPEMHSYFEQTVQEKYKDIDMFIQYEHALMAEYNFNRYPFPEKMWVHVPYRLPSKKEVNFEKAIKYFNKRKNISIKNLIHHSSHTDCAVILAYALGYKKIVLLGVDLNGSPYFTKPDAKQSLIYPFTPEYDRMNQIRDEYMKSCGEFYMKNHPSMVNEHVQRYNVLTLEKAINILNQMILEPNDVLLYVGYSSSVLAKDNNVYFK